MSRDPHIGKTLSGYTLHNRVGEGGMGVVYAASTAAEPERLVAVKVLSNYGTNPKSRQRLVARFIREGQAAATVNHDNVVRVITSGCDEHLAYLVMEYVEGASLGQVVDGASSLAVDKVTRIGSAIARGLAAIHGKGIVHRDIKPDNILLGRDGSVKIADLGLAKINDSADSERLTASGVVVGTPLYVAPETVRDAHRVDCAADIYSLGATLYHLLCGRPPFTGDSPYELMRAHLEKEPRPLREINPHVPKWLSNLVQRCMAKDPSRRPSARELALCLLNEHDVPQFASHPWRRASMVAAVLVAVAAILWWRLSAGPDAENGSTVVRISGWSGPALEWRSNDSPWQAVSDEHQLSVPSGDHDLQLRTHLAGITLSTVAGHSLANGQEMTIQPDMRPQRVLAAPHTLPSSGSGSNVSLMVVAGHTISYGDAIAFSFAGSYPVALFSPGLIRESLITVDASGSRDQGWRVVTWPSAAAYFATTGQPQSGDKLPPLSVVEPYHVVSRMEYALVMERPAPSAKRATEAQRQLRSSDLRQWQERVTRHGIGLPDREQAQELSALLGSGVWFSDNDRLYFHGSPEASQAMLVAVPLEP